MHLLIVIADIIYEVVIRIRRCFGKIWANQSIEHVSFFVIVILYALSEYYRFPWIERLITCRLIFILHPWLIYSSLIAISGQTDPLTIWDFSALLYKDWMTIKNGLRSNISPFNLCLLTWFVCKNHYAKTPLFAANKVSLGRLEVGVSGCNKCNLRRCFAEMCTTYNVKLGKKK